MRLRFLNRSVTIVLVGYAVISTAASFYIGGFRTQPSEELFPFFTWSLFSWVPDTRNLYVVEVIRLDGQTFQPPRDMRDIPVFADKTTLASKATQSLGRTRGQDEALRQTFETRYLKNREVVYRLVRESYNPLDRWRNGSVDERRILGEFESGVGQ